MMRVAFIRFINFKAVQEKKKIYKKRPLSNYFLKLHIIEYLRNGVVVSFIR